jgi:hypothetical protein
MKFVYCYSIKHRSSLATSPKAGIQSIIFGFRIKCGMTESESFFLETALAILDELTGECLSIDVERSITAKDVILIVLNYCVFEGLSYLISREFPAFTGGGESRFLCLPDL